MKIIAVDDEIPALNGLLRAIGEAAPDAEVNGFEYPEDALAFLEDHECHVAFLDVEMAGMNGVELAEKIKRISPDVNIIFSTGFEHYRKEAFELHASGYITKPITEAKITAELAELRRPVPQHFCMRVQTFGNFEAYAGNKPLSFRYSKTKEMLAYLVDRRGALCTNGEIIAVLFEDSGNHDAYLRRMRKDLVEALQQAGCADVLVQQRGKQGVVPRLIDCDYYNWCDGKRNGIVWRGEYMAQYSWGEYTAAMLERRSAKE